MKESPDSNRVESQEFEDIDGETNNDLTQGGGGQFISLCDNVDNAIITTKDSFQHLYLFHDELSKKNLPVSTLRKLTTISCNLQKNMSHLLIEVERLVEKTRMYAQPFENNCNVLKDLRHQNIVKQQKFNIAVKKLEIMSGRNEQLERQRIVGKWERLFLKCSNFKKGNLGWRHTIEEYKTKLKNNDSVAYLFRNLQSEDSDIVENISGITSDVPLHDENDFRFSSDDEVDVLFDRYSTATSMEEELMFGSHLAESSVFDWVSKNSTEVRKSCDILIDDLPLPSSSMSKSRLSDYNDDLFCTSVPEVNIQLIGDSVNLINSENTEAVNIAPTNGVVLHSIVETPETVDVYTSTTKLDSFFQVRIIKPTWSNNDTLFYILTFGNQVKKNHSQGINPYDFDASLEYSDETVDVEDVFSFDLECSSDDVFKSEGLKNTSLRIAIHEDPSAGMLAFSSISTNDLCIFSEEEIKDSNEKVNFHNKLELHFPSKNKTKDVKDGSNYLSIICSVYQKEKECFTERSTETLTYDALEEVIVENYTKCLRERCKSACVETEEKPIYTEESFNAVSNELAALKEGCESSIECKIRVDTGTSPLLTFTEEIDGIQQYDVDGVQHYPRHSSCPARHVTFNDENNYSTDKVLHRESTIPKMSSKSKRICEKLPEDFFTRLRLFQEERGKNRDQLKKEVTEKNHVEICKRLEAEKKLCLPDGSSSLPDNCLPSLFMPIKNNVVYKVKARSYFHPSNQVVNACQMKPIFQLPNVRTITSDRNLRGLRLEAAEAGK